MTRRLVSAPYSSRPARRDLDVSQTRITAQQAASRPAPPAPPASPPRPRPACSWTRSTRRRRLHRLLPVRLRRLDRQEPGALGSCRLRPVRRAVRAEQRDAAPDSRGRRLGARSRVEEDRRLLRLVPRRTGDRRQGRRAAGSAAQEDRRRCRRVNDLAPLVAELHTIGVNVFFQFGSQADFKDASVEMAIVDQGGLGLPDRDYYFKDDPKSVELRSKYLDHVGRMSALLGAGADQAAPRRGRPWRSKPRWRRARSTPCRAAIRTRSTTRCRPPSCRRSRRSSCGRAISAASARRRSTR